MYKDAKNRNRTVTFAQTCKKKKQKKAKWLQPNLHIVKQQYTGNKQIRGRGGVGEGMHDPNLLRMGHFAWGSSGVGEYQCTI